MAEDPFKPDTPDEPPPDSPAGSDARDRERDRGLSDFVRRAVAAGFEAAGRSKEDIVRIATGEIRDWLDRLELDTELRKALSRMVLEVKAEIRFRPADGDALGAEAKTELHVRRNSRDKE
jgi:hypothetical protein